MEIIFKFLEGNFILIFLIVAVISLANFAYLCAKRLINRKVYPKARDSNVLFSERYASGNSHKTFFTKIGGASNCLNVIVTDSALAVYTFFPFNTISDACDLEHLISLKDISEINPKGNLIDVEFTRIDGSPGKLTLRLRNNSGFLEAIRQVNKENTQHAS